MTWAIVTGASGGLGQAFARYLASSGLNVGLVARNEAALRTLADQLRTTWGVETAVWRADLTQQQDRHALIDAMAELPVNTLVNNAGYGLFGDIATLDAQRQSDMVTLNCVALTELTRAALPGMLARRQGSIINVASVAAFQPIPTMATYAASKAYVLSFTEGLWAEVAGTGVRTIAICPGPTETGFFEVAGDNQAMASRRTPEQVVQTTFAGLRANKPHVVDGLANRIAASAARLAPTRLVLKVARRTVGQ